LSVEDGSSGQRAATVAFVASETEVVSPRALLAS
jgi:hypothetical protein